MRDETRFVHAGHHPDEATGAVVPPIHLSTTYAQEAPAEHLGYEYARTLNPTRHRLEQALADHEGAAGALAFSSGMAAITTLCLGLLEKGDRVVLEEDCYGGTRRFFVKTLAKYGVDATFVDSTDAGALDEAAKGARMLLLESPTNPLLKVVDLEQAARIGHEHDLTVVVDNTFATPYLQRPLDLGADAVVHSITKFLGGHSDVVMGCLAFARDEDLEACRFQQNSAGAVPGPLDCYLVLRGMRTLPLRVERASRTAMMLAERLNELEEVTRVLYPGLKQHPGHDIADAQMRLPGSMLSFELEGGMRAVRDMIPRLRFTRLAESLGAVETLLNHPAAMTHASVPPETRERLGITDGLVRVSTGIEAPEDIIGDLEQAIQGGSA